MKRGSFEQCEACLTYDQSVLIKFKPSQTLSYIVIPAPTGKISMESSKERKYCNTEVYPSIN